MSDDLSNDLASLRISREPEPRGGAFRSLLVWLGVLGGLGTLGIVAYPRLEARFFAAEVDVTEISEVSPAAAAIELTSSGYVVPLRASKVGASVPGRVVRVAVTEGQTVQAGDVLVVLEATDQERQLLAARSRLAAARARTESALATKAEFDQKARRERALVAKGVSPKAAVQDLDAHVHSLSRGVKAAAAEADAAAAEVALLEASLAKTTIVAPITGTVAAKPVEVGELVGPLTPPVVELVDMGSLIVETDVPEGRLHLVAAGKPCEVTLEAFPDRRLRCEVLEVSPRVNRAKATATVKVLFVDPTEGVLPDMAARVSFLTKKLEDAEVTQKPKTIVPAAAIVERQGTKVVFTLDGETVRMVPVTLGPPFGTGFELAAGPPVGSRVVKHPPPTLADGQKVKEKIQ